MRMEYTVYHDVFDEYLQKALMNYDLPGLTVGIWVGENSRLDSEGLSFEKAYGHADVQTGTTLETYNYFHMASVSKTLTACAVLKLVESGNLHLNDKLSEILPWIEFDDQRYKDITLYHLLTHTSGLPGINNFNWTCPDIDSNALKRFAMSSDVKQAKFINSPGENIFSYSDMGYDILGSVIQESSKMPYEDFVEKKLFIPCSMNDSTMLVFKRTKRGAYLDPDRASKDEAAISLSSDELLKSSFALPHLKDEKKHTIRQSYYPYNRRHAPSSTLNSNIFEIKKWGDAHINMEILNKNTYKEMWKQQTVVQNSGEGMGLGWFIRTQNKYTLYGHEGMDDGFRASFWICPELQTQITVLSNIDRAPVKKINKKLFDLLTLR